MIKTDEIYQVLHRVDSYANNEIALILKDKRDGSLWVECFRSKTGMLSDISSKSLLRDNDKVYVAGKMPLAQEEVDQIKSGHRNIITDMKKLELYMKDKYKKCPP